MNESSDAGSSTTDSSVSASCDGGSVPTAYALDGAGILYRFELGSPLYKEVAIPDCGNPNVPWTMTASNENVYILYTDWSLYQVDLTTFACTQTPFQTGQLGLEEEYGIAVSSVVGLGERLFVYGIPDNATTPILAVSDLDSFVLTKVGDISPPPLLETFPVNLSADRVGHLTTLSTNGFVQQIDQASGSVLFSALSGVITTSTWANIGTTGNQVFLFADERVAKFDFESESVVSNFTTNVAPIGAAVVGSCP